MADSSMQERIVKQKKSRDDDRRMKVIMGAAIAVIVALALIVAGAITYSQSSKKTASMGGGTALAAKALKEFEGGKPLQLGESGSPLDLYFDYSCPHCAEIDAMVSPALMKAIDEGKIKLLLHPVQTQDFAYNHAATAAVLRTAVAQPDKIKALHEALLADYLQGAGSDGIDKYRDPSAALQEVLKVAKSVGINDSTVAGLSVAEADGYLRASSQAWAQANIKGVDGNLGTPMYVRDNTKLNFNLPAAPGAGATDKDKKEYMEKVKNYFSVTFVEELLKK